MITRGLFTTLKEISWLIDGKSFAREVINANQQIRDCGASRECPNCHYRIDNSDVANEWPGTLAGVKFDPSDEQLIQHLEAKCAVEGSEPPHAFLDAFIPTIEENQGINYTHPENLPGARKDGNSVYFFHQITNAYATGQRKRRKIDGQNTSNEESVRWHKTGKTKPLVVNGAQKGWKKIMVLYGTSKKSKPYKSNWVMHQYHLGDDEEEKGGQYVVSKVLYQQRKRSDKTDDGTVTEDPSTSTLRTSRRTPTKPTPHDPHQPGESVMFDDIADNSIPQSSAQELDFDEASFARQLEIELGSEVGCLADESEAVEDEPLLREENISSSSLVKNSEINNIPSAGFAQNANEATANSNASHGASELENILLDTRPDFQGVRQLAINLGDDNMKHPAQLEDQSLAVEDYIDGDGNMRYPAWLEDGSQAFQSYVDDSALHNEDTSSYSIAFPGISELQNLDPDLLLDCNLQAPLFDPEDDFFSGNEST